MKLRFTYYKRSGKYYTTDEIDVDPARPFFKLLEDVQRWRHEARLPGLQRGTWEGPFVVEQIEANGEVGLSQLFVEDWVAKFTESMEAFATSVRS